MKTLLLIDANALIHRAFHALPPFKSSDGKPVQALYGLSSILLKLWREEKPDYAAAFFDLPRPTFRETEYREYKAQRPAAPDELVSQIIEAHNLFGKFGVKTFELAGFEADDLIGTFAERFKREADLRVVILTGDMDTLQLVDGDRVVVKAFRTGVSDTAVYDAAAVKNRFGIEPGQLIDYKALVGDQSDNIPGVAGVGPKTASSLLQKYGSLEEIYRHLDQEPKIAKKFAAAEKDAGLFKKLVAIKRDVPVNMPEIKELAAGGYSQQLRDYFSKLGFRSLIERLETEIKPEQAPDRAVFENAVLTAEEIANVFFLKDIESALNRKSELVSAKIKAGFDLKQAIKAARAKNIDIAPPLFDFGVAFWLIDPDFKKYTPEFVFKKFLKREWSGRESDFALAYRFLRGALDRYGLVKVFEGIEMPLISILADMEMAGIAVDLEKLKKLSWEISKDIFALVEKINQLAGRSVNLNSPKQLSALFFETLGIPKEKIKKTAGGLLSTGIDSLAALRKKHPVVGELMRYRELFKIKSTYIEPILKLVGADGRLRTNFIQTGAATGRLSSQNPNLQNIPTGTEWSKKLRSVFIAKPGFHFAAFDYAQLELKILASLSEDGHMIESFRRGEDIHNVTAATVFKVTLKDVTPEMRRLAKTLNFGIVYGMGATSFAKTANLKREEAREFIENYFRSFPGIKQWQEKIKQEARANGYVKNINGRRRNVSAITYGSSRYAAEAERAAINMPVQSLGADIIKLAMIETEKQLRREGFFSEKARLILSIHDELLFEIEDDMMEMVSALIKKTMESVFNLKVPLEVKVQKGKNWAELQ